jgi:hypothetical protein
MSDDGGRVFGTEYDSFEEAFSDVAELELHVEETDMVETQRSNTYDADSLPGGELRCSNDLCKNGGVFVDTIISGMISNDETELETTESCKGHESMGRNESRSCAHLFHLDIEIEYED